MDRETAVFLAVALVLLAYVVFGGEFLLAVIAALGLLYILPLEHLPKLLGYLVVSDVLFGLWLMGIAAATLGGFTTAVLCALIYAVLGRELRCFFGTQRLAVDGEVKLSKQVASAFTWLTAWCKALIVGFRNGKVEAPAPLVVSWTMDQAAGGWPATRSYRAVIGLYALIMRLFDRLFYKIEFVMA
jgi:hypothetical protein